MDAWVPWGTSTKSTKRPLIVALWSLDTQGMQHVSLAARWQALKACVERAYKLATARLYHLGHDPKDRPLAIFVAPEYLVAHPVPGGQGGRHYPPLPTHGLPGDRRHIDEADKDLLLQRYVGLSDTCKGMILVPGTIAWRKPLERSGWDVYHMRANHPQWGQPKAVSRYDKAMESVRFYAERQGLRLDRPLSGPLRNTITAPTTQQKLDALQWAKDWAPLNVGLGVGFTPDEARYMARNTAYVLLDGKLLLKYNKQGDFHEVLVGKDTVHIPGRLDGRFQVTPTNKQHRTIDFGLEVCLDHVFQTTGKEIAHLGKVDVHIISSAQVSNQDENVAAANAGYLVHASSNKDYTGVKRQGFWGLGDEKPFATEMVSGFPLQLWQIELDLTPLSGTVEPSTEPRRKVY